MPRAFTAFVAQTPDPDGLYRRFETAIGDELRYDYERAPPRCEGPNRIRIEGTGLFNQDLTSALETEELGPVDWAIVMNAMDEGIGVNAWVFDESELLDTFEGEVILNGLDTEAYLERFHGVVVDRAGPYVSSAVCDPSLTLATEHPDTVLAETAPEPPFTVTGDDFWVLAVAETGAPNAFKQWFADELKETGLLLDDSERRIERPWVTDGPTTVEYESPSTETPNRVRARIPFAYGGVTDDGLGIPFGMRGFDGPVDWIVVCYGDAETEQVTAWVFVKNAERFMHGDRLDYIEGEPGVNGADVEAYLERFYGFDVDPTPAGVETPRSTDIDLEGNAPPDGYTEILDEYGIQYPSQ